MLLILMAVMSLLQSKVREGNLSTLATHTRMESHLRELDDGLRQANDQCATINTECKRRWEKAQHSHDRSKTSVATTIEDVANLKLKLMQMEAVSGVKLLLNGFCCYHCCMLSQLLYSR